VPLFAYHLSVKWALKRRVRNLENSLKTLATSRRSDAPAGGDGALAPMTASAGDSRKPDTPDSAPDGGADGGGSGGDGGGGD
jgi:putative membrane protein